MHNSKNKEQSMICFVDDKKRKIILIAKKPCIPMFNYLYILRCVTITPSDS